MKVFGNKSLASFLKILLQIAFVVIVVLLVAMPFLLKNGKVFVIYPNAICLLVIMLQFINLFDLLKLENPFCEKTEKLLGTASIASGVCAVVFTIQTLYEIILAKVTDLYFIFGFIFMIILFVGVAIALYMLKELFKQATKYKNENDLTI